MSSDTPDLPVANLTLENDLIRIDTRQMIGKIELPLVVSSFKATDQLERQDSDEPRTCRILTNI